MDSTKEIQPAQRVKQMIVQMDTALTECPDLMTALLVQLQEMNTQYRVISASPSCSVSWKRINVLRSLNKELTNVSIIYTIAQSMWLSYALMFCGR